jgi:uncharacterized membrane protein YheB (UPF0754 family)
MNGLTTFFSPDLSLLQLICIPVISGFVGWATNFIAVQMTFYPIQFIGISRWFGWRGVIPRKAEKMARVSVDRAIARFGDIQDVFYKLDPSQITQHIIDQVEPRIEEYVDDIMYEHHSVLWDNLPYGLKDRIYQWSREQLPRRIEALVAEFGKEFPELIDMHELFVGGLRDRPELMVRIFKEAGSKEFPFIIRSGWFFGGLFGIAFIPFVHLGLSSHAFALLGFLVGFFTNWIALNLVFKPLNSRNLFGFKFQGLFLKRQDEVSEVWSRIIAEELITVERVSYVMVHGQHAHQTHSIIQRHIRPMLDQSGIMKMLTQIALGASGYAELKHSLNNKAIEISTKPFQDPKFIKSRAPIIAEELARRMKALSPAEFQDVLRPAFQEEEWQLMMLGGVLGALAGLIQWLLFF